MRPPRRRAFALWLGLALLVRGLTALAVPDPGFADASYAFHVATRLVAGEGLTEEVVWNYLAPPPPAPVASTASPGGPGGRSPPGEVRAASGADVRAAPPPPGLPRPSNAYWPPGPALFAAAGAVLLPDSIPLWRRTQALPLLGAALLVAGTYLMARREAPGPGASRRAATAAALVLGGGIYFPYWVTTDGFTPFALVGGAAIWLSATAAERPGGDAGRRLFAAGLLAGVAQGIRADGLLLLLAPLTAAVTSRWPSRAAAGGAALAVAGAAAGALPLVLRSLLTWGTPAPPGVGAAPWLTAYDDLFRFVDPPTLARWLAAGPGAALSARIGALEANLGVLGLPLLYLAAPLTVLGAWRLRRTAATRIALGYLLALYLLMSLVFPFQGVRGGFFHSLAALVPWLALWTAQGLEVVVAWAGRRRGWREGEAQTVLATALAGAYLLAGVFFTVELRRGWDDQLRAYRAAGAWLEANAPPGARLMAVDPPGVWYATGRSTVVTPTDGPEALLAAATAYEVDYVLLQPAWPPYLAPVYDGETDLPGLGPAADVGPLRLYRVTTGSSRRAPRRAPLRPARGRPARSRTRGGPPGDRPP